MEARASRGRVAGGKRGARGSGDGDSVGGEHRGRARGSHHRGRGRRDHYRGRGRAGGSHQRNDDEEADVHEDEITKVHSRRTLESNWDRYEESERQDSSDEAPTQRGANFHVLLESAGDSFSQFRFSEEKSWEMDSLAASQVSSLDLPGLARILQQVPQHQRLDLEAELLQVSTTPAELPSMSAVKQEVPKIATFAPPIPALRTVDPTPSLRAADPEGGDDIDEELELLLRLDKLAPPPPTTVAAETEESQESARTEDEHLETLEEPEEAKKKKKVTEEDLEDWLDSMIS